MRTINVLVVDDSLLFRELVHQELERDINIRVVAKAADAFEAGKRIPELKPDVLIVDVMMDKLSGVDFVRQLLPQYYVPVILVSGNPLKRAEAENIDGVLFMDKPPEGVAKKTDEFFNMLRAKLHALANGEPFHPAQVVHAERRIIGIGASTGGAEALETLLMELPSEMPPIVISQHMPPKFTKSFAERLNAKCRLSVKEAEDGDVVIPGQVYIAPGGKHMLIRRRQNRYVVHCAENAEGNLVCPCVDMLFDSLAQVAGAHAVGVLLTGMGRDGASGLLKMRQAGSLTIGQDEASSVVYGMPKAAQDMGAVNIQLPLKMIASKLVSLYEKRKR